MDPNSSSISPFPEETDIDYSLGCLINPYFPCDTFEERLNAYLTGSAPGLAWAEINSRSFEPFTSSIRRFFFARINAAGPQRDDIEELLIVAEETNLALKNYKALGGPWMHITEEAVAEVLGGMEQFRDHMDPEVLRKMINMRNCARYLKEVLEKRIWMTNTEIEKREMELPELGDLLMTALIADGQCHCENMNLFAAEQENREMVMKWFNR